MSDLSDSLSIDTPENILLNAELAGFGTRCIAAVIDYTILIVLSVIASYLFSRSAAGRIDNSTTGTALYALLQFVLVTFYHLLFELFWNGQTPGKRLIGIRVVQANGLPLTVSGAIIRNLVRVLDFLPVFYGVGLLVMFATRQTQRLGDLAARTVVIREHKLTTATVKQTLSIPYVYVNALSPIPAYIHTDKLSSADQRTVADYLQRRVGFQDRRQVSYLIARQIAQKMDDPLAMQEAMAGPDRADRLLEHVARAFEVGPNTST